MPPCFYCHHLSVAQIINSFDEPPEALCRQCLEDTHPEHFLRYQIHRREELLSKIIKIHHYDDTKLVIEFKDTAIAYEKKLNVLQETRPNLAKDILVPHPDKRPYIILQSISPTKEFNIPIIRCGYKSDVNFSDSMRKIFKTFEGSLTRKILDARGRIKKAHSKISEKLGIKNYSYGNWSTVRFLVPFALFWPIYPVYYLFKQKQNKRQKFDSSFFLMAPWFFFIELSKALAKSEKARKITDLTQLYVKKTEEASVGLYFEPKSGSFERFKDFYLQFSDGLILSKDSIHMGIEQDFEPIFYLKIEKDLKEELRQISLEQQILNKVSNFEESLTSEDHLDLLRHFKFI